MRSFASPALAAVLPLALGLATGCGAADTGPSGGELTSSTSEAVTASSIASLALANVGGSACGTNSLGSHSFDSSCTGNGGQPEYWCADFARWVWEQEGAGNTSELTAAAGSFYVYGQNHGTLGNSPAVGDAVVFDYKGGGVADHVALVTKVNSDGTIETASGDWNGDSGTEAQFSSTSHVVLNSPAYAGTVGSSPGVMGMTISGFIAPVGIAVADWGAGFVSQSFPLASTTLTMFAGQTLSQTLVLENTGAKPWDTSTRVGTTQPRDRASAFAAPSWVADNRLAEASGSVAPGDSFTFTFDFHAPAKAGNYLEYFGVVQEGVAWFSDSGQGGPPDDDLEANITVVTGVRGNLDAAACTGITGWTQDQATPDTASSVELTFDAPVGKAGAVTTTVSADVDRSDLCKAIGSCSHGFSVPPPDEVRDGKAHEVYSYGVPGVAGGDPVELAGGPLTFTCDAATPPTTGEGRPVARGTSDGTSEGSGAGGGTSSGGSWATGGGQGSGGGSGAGCSAAAGAPGRFAGGAWALLLGVAALVSRRRRAGATVARDARANGVR